MSHESALENCYFADAREGRPTSGPSEAALVCECPGLSGVFLRSREPEFDRNGLIPATTFGGRFWWTRGGLDRKYPDASPSEGTYDEVLSTEEIFAALERGFEVWVKDGPFDTRDEADYVFDVAWEAPDSGD